MELVLLIGLPASGKSTFYQTQFSQTHRLISKDLLKNNRRRDKRQRQLLDDAFESGQSVVLDNTHPSVAARAASIQWAKERNIKTIAYYLGQSVDECMRRNALRDKKTQVPDVGFFSILRDLKRPSYKEGFDEMYYVSQEEGEFAIEDWKEIEDG